MLFFIATEKSWPPLRFQLGAAAKAEQYWSRLKPNWVLGMPLFLHGFVLLLLQP
jgi:hypothetical protein